MNIIYIRFKLDPQELEELRSEFPQYEIFTPNDIENSPLQMLKSNFWDFVEILFDDELNSQELNKAHRLRWIHSPTPHIDKIHLETLDEGQNILISRIVEPDSSTISEFVLGAILLYSKNFLLWERRIHGDKKSDDQDFPEMWQLKDRILLQVGLGETGSTIAERAESMGMRVWGACPQRSFHPHCQKTYAFDSLHSLLPSADVVCICLPREKQYKGWFQENQLALIKEGAILINVSPSGAINEEALLKSVQTKNYRGVIVDSRQLPNKHSPLWNMPNVLLTPKISAKPRGERHMAYSVFRHNLRQYVRGNVGDMKNVVGKR
ncbi:Uncharacterized protein SCG7109_AL_00300, partial [Chlamydiales bacterium SCGC AG-110-M15]